MKIFSEYKQNNSGVFALKLALLVPLVLISVGAAVDTGRLVSAEQKLQSAADGAALSAAIVYEANNSDYKIAAKKSLNENMDPAQTLQNFDANLTDRSTIRVKAHTKLKPMFVQLFGYPRLDIVVGAESNLMGVAPVEIALVVDHSGSLKNNGGFPHLSTGLDVFMDTIKSQEHSENLYLSFIPWAGTVNIGSEHGSWLKPYDPSIYGNDTWHGCVKARDKGLDVTDTPPNGLAKFEPYAWPSNSSDGWNNTPVSSYSDYTDDINTFPFGPNAGCSIPMVSLTNNLDLVEEAIDEYQSTIINVIGTFTPVAMTWGHRAVSTKWQGFWKGPTPQTRPSQDAKKIIVFLSDGQANWNTVHKVKDAEPSPYGLPSENFLGVKNPHNKNRVVWEMERRFLEVCENIKSDGIEIYTIGFAMNKKLTKIYQQCATSDEHFFYSDASSKISEVFKKIGGDILEKQPRIVN